MFKTKFTTIVITALLSTSMLMASNIAVGAQDKAARRKALLMRKMQADFEAQKAEFAKEKEAMAAEIAAQQVTIEDYETKNKKLGYVKRKLTKQKKKLEVDQQKTTEALTAANTNIEALTAKLKATEDSLAFSQQQRKTILANLSGSNQSLATCEAKNKKLYDYGAELVDFYESPKAVKAIKDKPSFLQSKRVVLDNLLQDQQDLLNENRFEF